MKEQSKIYQAESTLVGMIPTCLACSDGWVLAFQIITDCENDYTVNPSRREIINHHVFIACGVPLCVDVIFCHVRNVV